MIRDFALNKQTDATHMLTPMPLAISMGVGSQSAPFLMPAVENINGQAITLHMKHKGVKTARDMKGFKFAVPFDYSMHNFLLRYFLAEGGVDPDKDVQIRAAPRSSLWWRNLRSNHLTLPRPTPLPRRSSQGRFIYFFQDIWDGTCALSRVQRIFDVFPNTFKALLKASLIRLVRPRQSNEEIATANLAPKTI